jgi:hypothetical protein
MLSGSDSDDLGGRCHQELTLAAARYGLDKISGVTDMPFLLWVVYPYAIWMGCCSVLRGDHRREK